MYDPVAEYRQRSDYYQTVLTRLHGQTCGCDHGDEELLNYMAAKLARMWDRLTDSEKLTFLAKSSQSEHL